MGKKWTREDLIKLGKEILSEREKIRLFTASADEIELAVLKEAVNFLFPRLLTLEEISNLRSIEEKEKLILFVHYPDYSEVFIPIGKGKDETVYRISNKPEDKDRAKTVIKTVLGMEDFLSEETKMQLFDLFKDVYSFKEYMEEVKTHARKWIDEFLEKVDNPREALIQAKRFFEGKDSTVSEYFTQLEKSILSDPEKAYLINGNYAVYVVEMIDAIEEKQAEMSKNSRLKKNRNHTTDFLLGR